MKVVVVESPAKAKTINKYLGDDFTVLASYGHVRDLPAKDGSVRPDAGFAMDWEVDPKAGKHLKAIAEALRGANSLFLATDPDREGEAISWHVCEVLGQKRMLEGIDVRRVVFNEITRNAILDAFSRPRELNRELVDAYLARRALDYLVGFTLSPVLWRKLPGSRSAGRVQSVALRLVCEREQEIENFRSQEYWTIRGVFRKESGALLPATLTHLDGRKLEKFDLPHEASALAAVRAAEARDFHVGSIERKQTRRHPAPPFVTSTLQQEASRKLSFGAGHTMRVAQKLYEGVSIGGDTVGLITYMRTDGVQMSGEAIAACRALVARDFGDRYLPDKPRLYKTKAKNAQEAHEAIRPTDVSRRPADVAAFLDADQLKLYTLIWKRTLASQMESAVLDQVAVDIVSEDGQMTFRATGSVVAFDGFLRVYREGRDDPERQTDPLAVDTGDDGDRVLPDVERDERLARESITPEQHFTQPPPRFTEASLVKRLEELGIGRPSTYASIISVLQERKYVRIENRRFFPEDRGRLVTAFLESFFERYVAYGFTADMEGKLDDISGGQIDWKAVLHEFWRDFSAAVDGTRELRVKEVLDALDRLLGPHFFRDSADGKDPRACPACANGRLALKLGKFGAFIGCSNYPECRYTRPLVPATAEETQATAAGTGVNGAKTLGEDPATGLPVSLRKGPYGPYVQLGGEPAGAAAANPAAEGKRAAAPASKPKRMSLPRGVDPESLDLQTALGLLSLPRTVGVHPETGLEITAGLGRFGPYLRTGDAYVSLRGDDDVLSIGLNRAVDVLARARPAKAKGKAIGDHPSDGKPILLRDGRYGAYIEHGGVRVTLPDGVTAETLSVEEAVRLLAAKAKKSGKPERSAAEKAASTEAVSDKGSGKAKKPRSGGKAKLVSDEPGNVDEPGSADVAHTPAKPVAAAKSRRASGATAQRAKTAPRKTARRAGPG